MITKKAPLTKNKKKWVKNRNVVLRGEQLNYNASQQRKYSVAINKIIKQMIDETKKQIKKLFESETSENYFDNQKKQEKVKIVLDASLSSKAKTTLNFLQRKFDKLFKEKSKFLSQKMLNDVTAISKSNLHSSLKQLSGGLSLKTGVVTESVKDVSKAIISENVSLIKTIPQIYFKNITGAVMRSITTGNGLADLVPEINKYSKTTERHATNMALDQTRKAYNSINKQRMLNVGVKQFEWIHTSGSRQPRESHIKIDRHIFSFSNVEQEQSDLGVPEADRGIPGHAINCRCVMAPVIDFSDDN
jgi:SPP1 gp7 family putative phage head morphogenesis protein